MFFVGMSEKTHPGFRDWLNGTCQQAGFTPRVLQDAELEPALMTFVAEGLGVTLAREHIKKLPHPGVAFRPLAPPVKSDYCIAWNRNNDSRALQQYIEIVKGLAAACPLSRHGSTHRSGSTWACPRSPEEGTHPLHASRREATVVSHHLPLTVLRPIALSYRAHTNKVLGRFHGRLHSLIGGEGGAQTARWIWPRKTADHSGGRINGRWRFGAFRP